MMTESSFSDELPVLHNITGGFFTTHSLIKNDAGVIMTSGKHV